FADVDGDHKLDLVVASGAGDLLTLRGRGDGTFEQFVRAERNKALVVDNQGGHGAPVIILSDQAHDSVSVQLTQSGTKTQMQGNGILGPRGLAVADLTQDGIADLIVANGEGNDVLVFP